MISAAIVTSWIAAFVGWSAMRYREQRAGRIVLRNFCFNAAGLFKKAAVSCPIALALKDTDSVRLNEEFERHVQYHVKGTPMSAKLFGMTTLSVCRDIVADYGINLPEEVNQEMERLESMFRENEKYYTDSLNFLCTSVESQF